MLVTLVIKRSVLAGLNEPKLPLERAFRRGLHVEIERRVDLEPLLVELLAELLIELLADPLDEVRRDVARFFLVGKLEREGARDAGVGVADRSVLAHQLDDRIATLNGAVRMLARIVALRCLGESGEGCRFGDVEVAHRFSEVALRRDLDAECAVAERDLIQVKLENLLLVILLFDGACDLCFAELPDECFLTREALGKNVPRELHGYRRESLVPSAGENVTGERAKDAAPIHAGVRVEPLVFGYDERLLDVRGDLVELDERSALEAELGNEAPVHRVQLGRLARRVVV